MLPVQPRANMMRITQEVTCNALKHACATQARVRVAIYKTDLLLTITDDGCDFDVATINQGYGLSSMRKRTEEVKVIFNLRSTASGTRIRIILPLNA